MRAPSTRGARACDFHVRCCNAGRCCGLRALSVHDAPEIPGVCDTQAIGKGVKGGMEKMLSNGAWTILLTHSAVHRGEPVDGMWQRWALLDDRGRCAPSNR